MRKLWVLFLILTMMVLACAKEVPPPETPKPSPVEEPAQAPAELEPAPTELPTPAEPEIPETVTFLSKDDVKIYASYYPGGSKGVILLHMLGSNRHAWDAFALRLHGEGYTVVAPDLRGHGASDLNYKKFSFADFNNMAFDVEATRAFVEGKEAISTWYIIGASIGANIALKYAASAEGIDMVALLSPGLEYRGVTSEKYLIEMNRPVFFAYSAGDTYAAESTESLYAKVEGKHHRTIIEKYAGNEHGTNLFKNTNIENELIEWLARP